MEEVVFDDYYYDDGFTGEATYRHSEECFPFLSILTDPDATLLDIDQASGRLAATIELNRPFRLMGTEELTSLVVTEAGSINLRGSEWVGVWATPIEYNPNSEDLYANVSRISVAQATGIVFDQTEISGVAWKDTGYSVMISWENGFIPIRTSTGRFDFQAELYDSGDVELRWEPDSPHGDITASAGIADETNVFPVQGPSFDSRGVGLPFLQGSGCRRFLAIVPPTEAPTLTPTSAPTFIPTKAPTVQPTSSPVTASPTLAPTPNATTMAPVESPSPAPTPNSTSTTPPEETISPAPTPAASTLPTMETSSPAPSPNATLSPQPSVSPAPVGEPTVPVGPVTMAPVSPPTPPVSPVSMSPVTMAPVAPPTVPIGTPTMSPTYDSEFKTYTQSDECNSEFLLLREYYLTKAKKLDIGPNSTTAAFIPEKSFEFVGLYPLSSMVVTSSGSINLRGSLLVGSGSNPISADIIATDPYDLTPRLSVAQTAGLAVPESSSAMVGVFYEEYDDSFIVSWQDLTHTSITSNSTSRVSFQAQLYYNGSVEVRWLPTGTTDDPILSAVGMEDVTLGLAFPADTDGFDEFGIGRPLSLGGCIRFDVTRAGDLPTGPPTLSPSPTLPESTFPSLVPSVSPAPDSGNSSPPTLGKYLTYEQSETECKAFNADESKGIILLDEPFDELTLDPPFRTLNSQPISTVSVYDNGTIWGLNGALIFRVAESPSLGGATVYYRQKAESMVITWVEARFSGLPDQSFSFEVELFASGDFEMRWQASSGGVIQVTSGLSDPTRGLYPVVGSQFNEEGLGNPFAQGGCRRFTVVEDTSIATTIDSIRDAVRIPCIVLGFGSATTGAASALCGEQDVEEVNRAEPDIRVHMLDRLFF